MVGIGGIGGFGTGIGISNLQDNFNNLIQLSTQLSTGKLINQASDNPAGLVISEQLNAQIAQLNQGLENIQKTSNVLDVAGGGLSQISDSLTKAKGLTIQAQDSTLSSAELNAIQGELNSILQSVDATVGITNFAGQQLLDGSFQPQVSNITSGISDVQVNQTNPNSLPNTVNVEVTATATQGSLAGTITNLAADTEFTLTGSQGTASFSFAAGATVADIETAINAQSSSTGVVANGGVIQAADVGSANSVTLDVTQGNLGVASATATGTDIEGTINGQASSGSGNTLSNVNPALDVDVTFDAAAGTGTFNFDVTTPGLTTSIGNGTSLGLGIQGANTFSLGASSGQGTLSSLFSGGANSLSANPGAASSIIDAAISEVTAQQGQIGAFQSNFLSSSTNSLTVATEELAAAKSQIVDADLAETISQYIQSQIQNQAGVSLLAQTNSLNQQNALSLLLTL